MKKLFTLVLLAVAVLYFSPTANARPVHPLAKHKHPRHHKHHHRHHHVYHRFNRIEKV